MLGRRARDAMCTVMRADTEISTTKLLPCVQHVCLAVPGSVVVPVHIGAQASSSGVLPTPLQERGGGRGQAASLTQMYTHQELPCSCQLGRCGGVFSRGPLLGIRLRNLKFAIVPLGCKSERRKMNPYILGTLLPDTMFAIRTRVLHRKLSNVLVIKQ